METKQKKVKEKFLKESGRFGAISSADMFYRRLINKISAKTQGTALDNAAVYAASKAYRDLLTQMEISKSKVLAEARRNSLR
jgi:dTDP-D-glucose 4,6-dehydratase